jgi:hypothetical protein
LYSEENISTPNGIGKNGFWGKGFTGFVQSVVHSLDDREGNYEHGYHNEQEFYYHVLDVLARNLVDQFMDLLF